MASTQDAAQYRVGKWVRETFGPDIDTKERARRLFEEVTELVQAEGIPLPQVLRIVAQVFEKPPGDPILEAGGVGTTLLAYAAGKGFSAEDAEQDEMDRLFALPPERFRDSQAAKAATGTGTPCGKVLFIFEEQELGGGYHIHNVCHTPVEERPWSQPYNKGGPAQYRSRIVKVFAPV